MVILAYCYWLVYRETVADRCIGLYMLLIITKRTIATGFLELLTSMTLNDLQLPKLVLVNFSQFLAAAHILRLKCDEMAKDGPRQPAYDFFALNANFCHSSFDPLFKEACAAGWHQRGVLP